MATQKALFILACCAVAVSALPQASSDDRRGIFDLLPSLFSTFFNRRPSFDPDFDRFPGSNSTSNATRSVPSVFTSVFGGLGPALVPSDGDMDMNSTHEVTVKDGHRVEVNRTVGGDKDGGFFFTRVLVNVVPMGDGEEGEGEDGSNGAAPTGTSAGVPPKAPVFPKEPASEDPRVNQEVTSSSPTLVRRKRWTILDYLNSLRRRKVKPKSLPTCHDDDESSEIVADVSSNTLSAAAPPPPAPVSPRLPKPPTLEGDTNVNYIGPVPRGEDPDAEVFDVDLVRADEERFRARTSAPVMAQPPKPKPPPRAEPPRSQPIRAEPVRSLRSQPAVAESLRSRPIRTEPLRSLRSQPNVDESLRSQAIRTEPLRSLRSHSIRAESLRSLRSQPAVAESLRSQAIRTEPLRSLRSQPVVAEPLRSQLVMAEPLQSLNSETVAEPLRSLRSQPTMAEPLRSLRSQPTAAEPLEPKPTITEPLRSSPLRQQALRSVPLETQVQRAQPTAPQLETQEFRLPFKKSLRLL